MADDKKLPPGMQAEYADGSGANDDRTRTHEESRADATKKDKARGKTAESCGSEDKMKKRDDAGKMAGAESEQLHLRGTADLAQPEGLYARDGGENYLGKADRFNY